MCLMAAWNGLECKAACAQSTSTPLAHLTGGHVCDVATLQVQEFLEESEAEWQRVLKRNEQMGIGGEDGSD
jgi:hypothetical protein